MDKANYIKYCRDGIAYYIREDIVPNIMRIERIEWQAQLHLLQYADFAVDTRENKIIKCRYMIEDLIEAAVNARPIQRSSDKVAESLGNLREELLKRAETDTTVREIVFKINSCLFKEYPHKR